MYKKILLSLVGIATLTGAHDLGPEKIETVKKRGHYEKHITEKQAAINNLKNGGIAALAAPALLLSCCLVMSPQGLDGERKLIQTLGKIPSDIIGGAMLLSIASVAAYSVYTLGIGSKHYFVPTYQDPNKQK